MACGTPVIGKVPNMKPEWMSDTNGVWTYELNNMSDIVAEYTQNWLEDNISEGLYESGYETVSKYQQTEEFETQVVSSVVLPIASSKHKNFIELFTNAIVSIKNQSSQPKELVLVHSNEESLVSILNGFDFSGITVNMVENKGHTDFASQMNLGVEKSTSEWVSFLEFDDEYASIWFKNVQTYIDAHPNVNGFLSLVVDVDDKGSFAGFTNEATFAASMNTEIGYLTNEVLLDYQNFQSAGMVIKKETYQETGGFKPSLILTTINIQLS